jgi:hypothetical protein
MALGSAGVGAAESWLLAAALWLSALPALWIFRALQRR